MRILRTLAFAFYTCVSACSTAGSHTSSDIKAIVPEDPLSRIIREEGRKCWLKEVKPCKDEYLKRNPNAPKTEQIPECEEIGQQCIQNAAARLNSTTNNANPNK